MHSHECMAVTTMYESALAVTNNACNHQCLMQQLKQHSCQINCRKDYISVVLI